MHTLMHRMQLALSKRQKQFRDVHLSSCLIFRPRSVFWVWALLHGDMGTSIFNSLPVSKLIGQRVEPTLSLTICTLIVAILTSVPLGAIAAARAESKLDHAIMGFSVLGFSIPVFVLAYLLILLFSLQLHWLPVQGYRPISEGIWPWFLHLILPSLALGTVYAALIARITRASVLDVLSQDYIRTAQAKGLKESDIMIHHALKNAAVPIITIIGIGIGLLISGAVVTETVFAIPGIGRLTVDAILRRDYPIIQGVILIFSATYVMINLMIDLSYVFFDPRIRY